MESKAKMFGHPIHPMLIVFPLGLLATSFLFDVIGLLTSDASLARTAFYMIGVGVIIGLAAGIFGLIDWLAIPGRTRAKGIGLLHGLGNLTVLGFFGASWLMRRDAPEAPEAAALILSLLGVALVTVTGWLGGELVNRLGVGVDKGANLNAPNSLSGQSASGHYSHIEPEESEQQYDRTATPT
jgi:uncharacterized membrane protein